MLRASKSHPEFAVVIEGLNGYLLTCFFSVLGFISGLDT